MEDEEIKIKPTWEHLSHNQSIALASCMKVSAFLSIAGSSIVIYQILAPHKREVMLKTMYHRIILTLSLMDIIGSLALFMSTWPIPKDTVHDDWIWGNVGNQITCDIQGYFVQSSVLSVSISTSFLCIYFMLLIRYKWSERRLRRMELVMRMIICFIFVISLVPLFYDAYNPTPVTCWIQAYPIGCSTSTSDEFKCTRGAKIKWLRFFYMVVPIVFNMITIFVTMSLLYASVRKQDQVDSRYTRSSNNQPSSRRSRKVFVKVVWFIGSFCLVWIPIFLNSVAMSYNYYNFWLFIISIVMIPLQGFFNAIIYNYEKLKNTDFMRRTSLLRIMGRGSAESVARAATIVANLDTLSENNLMEND